MRNRLTTLIFLFFLFPFSTAFSQDSLAVSLPETWLGEWKGEMHLFYANGKTQKVAVELHIQKTENKGKWAWAIFYGEGEEKQKRAYELLAINSLKGKYLIDEKNSILLDAFFADNTLMSRFMVMNNLIMTIYRMEGESLYFENISGKDNLPNISGGKDDIPEVSSYPVSVLQRGILKKIK